LHFAKGAKEMAKRVILAARQREYVAKLAEYLREEEPGWDIVSFTHVSALIRELQEDRVIDLLIGQTEQLNEVVSLSGKVGKVVALVEKKGKGDGEWAEIMQFQPLPNLLSAIRGSLTAATDVSPSGCQVLTIFSASGGTGKTTVAMNLIRQAGERGLRTFYLNMEPLNATSLIFGKGEPDSLSRLLYSLQAYPERWGEQLEQLCRHQPQLRTDFLDAPDHPAERLALTSELLITLLERLRSSGRYDLIVIDPDSGAGDWHQQLLEMSDRIVWLAVDDAQSLHKTNLLLRHWQAHLGDGFKKLTFVMNKGHGGGVANRWELPGGVPSAILPYIPQWKSVDHPGKLLGAPAFSGAVEQLIEHLGLGGASAPAARRRREEGHGIQRTHVRGAG
jgi:Mrp family chromosome partitioning ATPase